MTPVAFGFVIGLLMIGVFAALHVRLIIKAYDVDVAITPVVFAYSTLALLWWCLMFVSHNEMAKGFFTGLGLAMAVHIAWRAWKPLLIVTSVRVHAPQRRPNHPAALKGDA